MYIHATSKLINSNTPITHYRTLLKSLSDINLRRSCKFNVLAVYGALMCCKEITLSSNTGIYVATEYGSVLELDNILNSSSEETPMIMPFDFLNINTNNVGFYVSKALQASGKNMVLTAKNCSGEKALQLAKFDLDIKEVEDVLIGGIDESVSSIENANLYIDNILNQESKDGSCWIYANRHKENAIAHIDEINEYANLQNLEKEMFCNAHITLNQFATQDEALKDLLKENTLMQLDSFYGTEGILKVIELLNYKGKLIHIAKDNQGKYMVIKLSK
ncbi:MAG: hypothetical protein ACNI3C_03025 [Candidatus Marinarcus sp.]|uniref:hypothetical protein n=1 Tax=Candidatus Marinarcus sp. TaxID=3100987 RepID=UPI003B00DA25